MSASDLTVFGNIEQALGIAYARSGSVLWLEFNTENGRVVDDEGVERIGAGQATLAADGALTVSGIPAPGSSNPTSFQCKIRYDLRAVLPARRGFTREVGDFGWMTITGTSRTVTNKALTSNVATITVDEEHGLRVGDPVTVAGVDATFNGDFTLTAVTETTLSYAKTASNVASVAASGTLTSKYANLALLEEEQAVPAEYLTTVTEALEALVDEAEAFRDEAEAITGLTGEDAAVAYLIEDSASDTAAALAASYVRGVSATQVVMRKLEHDEDVNIVIASDSTDNAVDEWGARLGTLLGADYPTHDVLWHPILTDGTGYDTPTTLQTGTGSGTIHIWNCAVAGWNSYAWQGPNFTAQFVTPNPDLVLIATGHNESTFTGDPLTLGQPAVAYRCRILSVTEQIRQSIPHAQPVLIAQHEWLDGTGDMGLKRDEEQLIAQARGFGFVDMVQAFADDPASATYFLDNIHINAAGEQVYADTVHALFRYDPKWEPRPQPPSLFDQAAPRTLADDLVMPLTATAPIGWTAVNATVARDTTHYESGRGYGVRVQQTAGATPARIYRAILDSTTVVPWQGKWVLIAVRMYRPTAGGLTNRYVGRVSVSDGVGLSRTFGDDYTAGGFVWRLVPHLVDTAATTLTVSLWADELGTAANPDTTWDRLMIIPGQWPAGGFGRGGLKQVRNAERFESVLIGQSDSTAPPSVELDAVAGTNRDWTVRTAGLARWIMRVSGTESGSNTGSDLQFFARDDAGSALATAFSLIRRYGQAKFAAYATGSRPVASSAGAGAVLFDSTLNRPIWSDATNWHAAGSYLTATATLDFPSIAAGGQQELTITVTGAAVGDCPVVGPPAALEAGVTVSAYVSATNTVKIRLSNVTGSAIDPASATWRASIIR